VNVCKTVKESPSVVGVTSPMLVSGLLEFVTRAVMFVVLLVSTFQKVGEHRMPTSLHPFSLSEVISIVSVRPF